MKFACILINQKLVVKFRDSIRTMGPECLIHIGGVCHSTIQKENITSHLFGERIMSCADLYGEIIWLTKYINVQYVLHKFPMLSIIANGFFVIIVLWWLILHRIVIPQNQWFQYSFNVLLKQWAQNIPFHNDAHRLYDFLSTRSFSDLDDH